VSTTSDPRPPDSIKYSDQTSKQPTKRWITIPKVILIIFAIVTIGLLGFQGNNPFQTSQPSGQQAIDFTLNDIQGNSVSLSSFRGKVVIVEFMATWCGTCKAEKAELSQIQQQYESEVVILSISSDPSYDSNSRLDNYRIEHGITWTIMRDTDKITGVYNVYNIPAFFIIDQNQNITWKQTTGTLASFETLSEQIDLLLIV